MIVLDGKKVSTIIKNKLKVEIDKLEKKTWIRYYISW